MLKFRLLIVCLVVALALFFNIERLDLGDKNNAVDIPTFTYFFVTGATLSILLGFPMRYIRISSLLALWVATYFALRFYMFGGYLFGGEPDYYVLITEVSFLAILVSLAHWLAGSLYQVKKTVQDIALVNGHSLQTLASATPAMKSELTRSRHYDRKLSMILVDVKPTQIEVDRLVQEMHAEFGRRYAVAKVAKEISEKLRDIDQVFLGNKPNQIVVLCPETSHADSETIFSRIQPWIASRVKVQLRYGVATFPEEGITLNGLLTHAIRSASDSLEFPDLDNSTIDKSGFSSFPNLSTGVQS